MFHGIKEALYVMGEQENKLGLRNQRRAPTMRNISSNSCKCTRNSESERQINVGAKFLYGLEDSDGCALH
jgi:hypothetical protein